MADFTNYFNTKLTPKQEKEYQKWLLSLPEFQRSTYDYDLRGAYLAGDGRASNGHFPDTFKKPNHPTFSNQSKYSGVGGYVGGRWEPGLKGWSYVPSKTNLLFFSPQDLQQYFGKVEPNSTLNLFAAGLK